LESFVTFQPGARQLRVAVVALMAFALSGGTSAVPASAVTWSGITSARVAALTPTGGTVILGWVSETGDRFAVTDVSGTTPIVHVAALDASGWTSDTESPGTHTYRVTRTPGDGTSSSGSEVTMLVPTRELLVSEGALASAVAPGSNADGIMFDTAMTPGHASMSPDRKHLAVAFTGASFMELWLTDIAGKAQTQLTHGAFDTNPDFSPDGRTLAFTRRSHASNGPPAVYLLDLTAPAGNPSAEPVAIPGGTDTAMPSWTPAGDAVVVEEHKLVDDGNGTQVDAGPTGLAVLRRTGQPTVITGTSGGEYPSVSRTGRVAFGRFDPATGQGDIWVTDLSGAPALRWSPTPPTGTKSVYVEPAWDPQGDTIAATSQAGQSPGASQPVTFAAAGAPVQRWRAPELTRDSTHPSWVDLVDAAPSAILTAPATSRSSAVSASFTVADGDDAVGGLHATCQVDTRVAQPCAPGTWTASGLADGPHLLAVRVTDPTGRTGEAKRTVVVDAASRLSDFNRDGSTDLLARDTAGRLWVYPGNGAGGFLSRHQMGTGWSIMTALVAPGDVTGDGNADVLGRDTAGRLWLYPGNGANGLSTRRQIGSGWGTYTITNAGNINGAGGPDLLARDSAGSLWLYPLSGNAVFGTRIRIGIGWNSYTIRGPGDFSGDGRADILARDMSGTLWLYRGNGVGGVTARTLVSSGWQAITALVTPGNWDLTSGHDLLARDSLGRLWLYPGNNAGGFGTRRLIGIGWNGLTLI
jgi:FG-GAP-like repeat/WD40-like Beta Propeller Repeat